MVSSSASSPSDIEAFRLDYSKAFDSSLEHMLAPMRDARLKEQLRREMRATPLHVVLSTVESMFRGDIGDLTEAGDLISGQSISRRQVSGATLAIFAAGEDDRAGWPKDTEIFLRQFLTHLDFQRWKNVAAS